MGLKLRLNLFYQADVADVYDVYRTFYRALGKEIVDFGEDFRELTLYEQDRDWTVLSLDAGWEWTVRREAQLEVSRRLNCRGFLIFVYDGDYWGYEFFQSGKLLDHFVQVEDDGLDWFPGWTCAGNARLVASELPYLSEKDLAEYLVRDPHMPKVDRELTDGEEYARWAERERLDVPVRPGDEFNRFDECAVVDFLRFLGVRVELRDHYVTLLAPKYRSFWIVGRNSPAHWWSRFKRIIQSVRG